MADQDRKAWNHALIAEGQSILRRCLRRNKPGPYQIQAAINAVHSDAARPADTDWRQILQLYDQLMESSPTPIVALNRAVAVAEVNGPHAALVIVEQLELNRYYLFHAVRANLLERLGRHHEAAAAYESALACDQNLAERTFLERRRRAISGGKST
jgi:RNA polymerase sigma-70 factor (ECF subfamily)